MPHLPRRWFLASALCLCLAPALSAAEALTETQKIEALLKHVAELQDATFIRNGSEYSAKTAAKFLRGKWEKQTDEVKTARDFIEKIATKSGTTGKPYLIKLKEGGPRPCAECLLAELAKLEQAKP